MVSANQVAQQRRETLDKVAELVWDFREQIGDLWPTPHQGDALRFAFTEAGEVLDAWLRIKGGYARNNEQKQLDMLDELADVTMMLITALGPGFVFLSGPKNYRCNLDGICAGTGYVFHLWDQGKTWHVHAQYVLAYIVDYFERQNESLIDRVQQRLNRIYNKVTHSAGK